MIVSDRLAATGGESPTVVCALAASGWLSTVATDLPRLRGQVTAAFPSTLTSGSIKQADEQCLVALLALRQALDNGRLRVEDCEAWGVVAGPRMLGRKRIADSISKFRDQGAWSVSPHVIPNCSLHSPSGLFSQALGQHGPNIGAGGVPGIEGEALLAALTLLVGEQGLPGVWLVLSGWDHESLSTDGGFCQAAVMGLLPDRFATVLPRLSFTLSATGKTPFTLESLGESIRTRRDQRWNVGGALCTLEHHSTLREAAA